MKKPEFFLLLKPAQKTIDLMLREWIYHDIPPEFKDLVSNALFPGRRLRPALFLYLLSTSLHKSIDDLLDEQPSIKNICLSIEILHRAGIIVDDIVDFDAYRRGQPTFSKHYGEDTAILMAHFLTSQSLYLANKVGERFYKRVLETYANMCIGQLTDIKWNIYNGSAYNTYRQVVLKKTNSLFKLLFETITDYDCTPQGGTKLFKNIGIQLGNLYQITNDYYDFLIADTKERGNKERYRFNLDIITAIALDDNAILKDNITPYIGKALTKKDYTDILIKIKSPKYSKKAQKIINSEYNRLKHIISKIPKSYSTILNSLVTLIMRDYYWNHNELTKSGY